MINLIGRATLKGLQRIGSISIFVKNILVSCITRPFYGKQLMLQMVKIGFYSLPIVALTSIFTGMVLALQSYTGFSRFSATSAIATVVVLSITRELGPVLTGLMVSGRVGAAMTAELATMRVSDQIDAMYVLQTSPYRFLMAPRFLACVVSLPLLTLVADTIGVYGGYLISVKYLGFNKGVYLDQTFKYLTSEDVVSGLIKAAVFGSIIGFEGCYNGFHSRGGAEGVGISTTQAVVRASIFILIANYVLTLLLFHK